MTYGLTLDQPMLKLNLLAVIGCSVALLYCTTCKYVVYILSAM